MKISEIFYSRQGEGVEAGKRAVFVRLADCNLRCNFCDTKYAYKGDNLKMKKIIILIKKYNYKNIVWTGGEPALQIKKISSIINKLKNYKHSIETNGTLSFNTKLFKTIAISPKKQAINEKLVKKYKNRKNVYFKFVIEDKENYIFWKKIIKKLKIPKKKVYFMPEAKARKILIKKSKWLIPKAKKDGFKFSSRLQIYKDTK